MPEYLLLIYENESAWEHAGPDVQAGALAAHREFAAKYAQSVRGGSALQPSVMANSLRHGPDGTIVVTDGVFIETKEIMGGYYLVEAADLEEATRIAHDVPVLSGGVEVRPLRVFE